VTAVLIAAIATLASWPYVLAASFIIRGVALGGWLERGARTMTSSVIEQSEVVPTRHGSIRARLYRPTGSPARAALLVGGVNPAGIDEPRLIHLAREVAAGGWAIVTPELSDLIAYRVTPRSTDIIEDAAVWLAARHDLVSDGRIGLVGISFSGGLSIVAAGRPALHDRARFVLSFGGHGDLPRVLNYLCTGIEPDLDGAAHRRAPHDYGLAVLAFGLAEDIVPPEQVERFREAVHTFLRASGLAVADPRGADGVFEHARALERTLPQPSQTLMQYVNERNVGALGSRLLPHLGGIGTDPALSPDRSESPRAAVYLLHGLDDNVIPASETRLLARWLDGKTLVRAHVTPLITHAEVNRQARLGDYWELIRFWRDLLKQ